MAADEGEMSTADCLTKHGGRCVKNCDEDEKEHEPCTGGICCAEK